MRIDLNFLTSDQHHITKCLWNSVILSDFKRGSCYFLELYDWRVMEATKCNNLLYIPIVDYCMIAGCKRIDLNFLTSDQHHTKCLWTSVILSYFKRGSCYFLELYDWRVMEVMKCNNVICLWNSVFLLSYFRIGSLLP
jgi:hypothetical protein